MKGKIAKKLKKTKIGKLITGISIAITGVGILREIAVRESFKLAFTMKPSLIGRKMMANPLYFVPKKDVKWLYAQKTERLTIRSFDGLTLVGHYFPGRNAKRLIIMSHGWHGTWAGDFGQMARFLHDMECDLLLIEQRAQGESEGEYMSFGILESMDLVQWVELAAERSSLPIYLYGVSMGATSSMMASGKSRLNTQVAGVIADCGFASPYDILYKVAKSIHPILTRFIGAVDRKCLTKAGFRLNDDSAIEAMKRVKVPVLFIHGESDSFVPIEMGYQNYEACITRKKMITIEGADHCQSFVLAHHRILDEIWEFFDWERVEIPSYEE